MFGPLLDGGFGVEKAHAVVARSTFWNQKMLQTPHFWGSRSKKTHAIVARSTFWNQTAKNNTCSDYFWRLRREKSARCLREAHFELKTRKTHHVWTTFGRSTEFNRAILNYNHNHSHTHNNNNYSDNYNYHYTKIAHFNTTASTTTTVTTTTLQLRLHYTTPHYIQQLWVRWSLQPLQKAQLHPPFGQSVDLLCLTATHLSYSFLWLKLPLPPCAVLNPLWHSNVVASRLLENAVNVKSMGWPSMWGKTDPFTTTAAAAKRTIGRYPSLRQRSSDIRDALASYNFRSCWDAAWQRVLAFFVAFVSLCLCMCFCSFRLARKSLARLRIRK